MKAPKTTLRAGLPLHCGSLQCRQSSQEKTQAVAEKMAKLRVLQGLRRCCVQAAPETPVTIGSVATTLENMQSPILRQAAGQTLMIDADDTLWENNVLFEQAIASFIEFLDHKTHTPTEVREHLNRVEAERVKIHGYGLVSFRTALAVCFEELAGVEATRAHHDEIERFTAVIAAEEMQLLDGVHETLHTLHTRHRLLLVTKGDTAEQKKKLHQSGLAEYFHGVEVLREKHEAAYRDLQFCHDCVPSQTWMIGNSPKSDINPALAAGLNAIYVPHWNTWVLEHEDVCTPPPGQTLLQIERFSDLLHHF